ncbi:MAG: hypothetical protein ACLQBQ_09760, partial [Smithella sp.]
AIHRSCFLNSGKESIFFIMPLWGCISWNNSLRKMTVLLRQTGSANKDGILILNSAANAFQ